MGGTASLGCASRSPRTIERNVARTRTTKKLAQRIDLNYFKRSTPFKRAKFWLSLLLPFLALLWIAEQNIFKDFRVYSSGRLSEPHAVLEKECAACHAQKSGSFSAKASDSACLDCHDGPSITPRKRRLRRAKPATRNTAAAKISRPPAIRLALDATAT